MLNKKIQDAREMLHASIAANGVGRFMTEKSRHVAMGVVLAAVLASPILAMADQAPQTSGAPVAAEAAQPGMSQATLKDTGIGAVVGNVAGYLFHTNRVVSTIAGAIGGGFIGHEQTTQDQQAANAKAQAQAASAHMVSNAAPIPGMVSNAAALQVKQAVAISAPANITERLDAMTNKAKLSVDQLNVDKDRSAYLRLQKALNPDDKKMAVEYKKSLDVQAKDWDKAKVAFDQLGSAVKVVGDNGFDVSDYVKKMDDMRTSALQAGAAQNNYSAMQTSAAQTIPQHNYGVPTM